MKCHYYHAGIIVIIIIIMALILALSSFQPRLVNGKAFLPSNFAKAPVVISGDDLYIAWWWANDTTNNNDEVMFRASNDGGASFADKINLSNTTGADSQDIEIAADDSSVVVTWWERNETAEEPVARISNDNGQTFGPLLKLTINGTIAGGGM